MSTTSESRKCESTSHGLRWKCTVSAPSGACNSVPKKMPNPSPRKPRRAAIQVTSVSRIVKNAKTRFPNSMYEWKLFGSKWCGAQPGQCSQPSPDPVSRTVAPNAVTDVTGFGLLGHAHEMASRSGVRITLAAERLPAMTGALESARAGVSTAGTRANREYGDVELGAVAPELVELAFDPQTAGGLLVSLPRDRGPALEAEFARAGLFLARIGAVEDGTGVVLS